MDTVTEARLAIAMAQEGGIGIVHKNLHAEAAGRRGGASVKRYESGVLRDPITITPEHDGARGDRAVAGARRLRLSGGARARPVVGIVTNRDLRFETRLDAPVREIMTPRDKLITVPRGRLAGRSQGADAQATSSSACWSSTTPSSCAA